MDTEGVVVEGCRGSGDIMVRKGHISGPIPKDRPDIPTYLQAYTTNPSGLSEKATQVVQIKDEIELHCTEDG